MVYCRSAIRLNTRTLPFLALCKPCYGAGQQAPGKGVKPISYVSRPTETEALVHVREYLRFRFGQWETVRSHVRKWPRS